MAYDETWVYNYDVGWGNYDVTRFKGLKGSVGTLKGFFGNMLLRLNVAVRLRSGHGNHPWVCSWRSRRTLRRCRR